MIETCDTDLAAAAIGCGYALAEPATIRKGNRVFWRIETDEDLQTKFYVGAKGDLAVAKRVLDAKKYLLSKVKGKLTNLP
tara:strand:- start:625 stop:864 length:240 start_codon:yes stop_codon:yes gene_type:complete